YEAALRIKPDMHEALSNWGLALSAQAKQQNSDDNKSQELFSMALQKLEFASQLGLSASISVAYNLACLSALSGKEEESRKWLEFSRKHGVLPGLAELNADEDLNSLRNKPWFIEFLKGLNQ